VEADARSGGNLDGPCKPDIRMAKDAGDVFGDLVAGEKTATFGPKSGVFALPAPCAAVVTRRRAINV
jgi:hypothetical protein